MILISQAKCPFYPMRPTNGGRFDLTGDKGPDWVYEAKINGWRGLVEPTLGDFWNRYGGRSSIGAILKPLVPSLPVVPGSWLDIEILERRGTGNQVLIVLDAPLVEGGYEARRATFEKLPLLKFRKDESVDPGVYRLPSMTDKEARKFWAKWEGSKLIEGVVAKRISAAYIRQSIKASKENFKWMKHRYV
jgi:hypothetical protein